MADIHGDVAVPPMYRMMGAKKKIMETVAKQIATGAMMPDQMPESLQGVLSKEEWSAAAQAGGSNMKTSFSDNG